MTVRTYKYRGQALVTKGGSNISRSVTDAMTLDDEAIAVGFKVASDPMTFAETAAFTIEGNESSITDTLVLEETAVGFVQPSGTDSFFDELEFVETILALPYADASDDMDLTDTAEAQVPISRSQNDPMALQDEVIPRFFILNKSIEDDLTFIDSAGRIQEYSVSDLLDLEDLIPFLGADVLSLVDVVEWGYSKDIEDELTLSEDIIANVDLNKGVLEDLGLTDSLGYYYESPCFRYERNDFHGSGGEAPTVNAVEYSNKFSITSLEDGTIIQLRNPETDDTRRVAFDRVNRNLFDGTPDIYADPNGAVERTQLYTIVATKRDTLDELWDFLQVNLGLQVIIKDWKGVSWLSIITNPGEMYVEDQEGYWTLAFEVVGVRTGQEYVVEGVDLTEEISLAGSIYNKPVVDDSDPESNFDLDDDADFTIESP